jgi:hypothetical protein
VCFNCKKAFSLGVDCKVERSSVCPECGKQASFLNHKFRPPAKNEIKKWEVIEFLENNGFIFQHIFSVWMGKVNEGLVEYPETMNDAKEFVVKYREQAIK